MVITRTPFRESFFGGGTDYPGWYMENGGSVLSTAINKYCYISIRYLPPFFEHRLRIVYSRIELCEKIEEIKHPSVRETLRFLNFDSGLEIHHDGDLPARSGMGSSSSFTVGLLHALYGLQGKLVNKNRLALESIHIEQNMIKETVGSQDQAAAAHGGLNHIIFKKGGEIEVKPITLNKSRRSEFNSHLMLFYTGIMRTASDVAETYVNDIKDKGELLNAMNELVEEGISILFGNKSISKFGELLHETWTLKRKLSSKVSNTFVDDIYQKARENGAIGGKISGAGGGGVMLFFVPPKDQIRVREALRDFIHIPFKLESSGSQIIFYDPGKENYNDAETYGTKRKINSFTELNEIEKKIRDSACI